MPAVASGNTAGEGAGSTYLMSPLWKGRPMTTLTPRSRTRRLDVEIVTGPVIDTPTDLPVVEPSTGAAPPATSGPPEVRGYVVGAALSILAALLLGLVAHLGVVSQLRHDRDQQVAYADFRKSLANATAPVGQVDDHGRLLALGTPVALIDIPKLHLHEVVLEGTTSGVLASGPGHRRDTVLPGQVGTSVLFGRHSAYGGPFRSLATLAVGTDFTVTTGQGTHQFRVTGVRRAGDPRPAALAAGQGRLTLVTADGASYAPDGAVWVDAALVSDAQPAPARALTASSLAPAEQALAGDSSAWMPLILWAQALLLVALFVVWARAHWGRWQAWLTGVPVLGVIALALADQVARLLPNLL